MSGSVSTRARPGQRVCRRCREHFPSPASPDDRICPECRQPEPVELLADGCELRIPPWLISEPEVSSAAAVLLGLLNAQGGRTSHREARQALPWMTQALWQRAIAELKRLRVAGLSQQNELLWIATTLDRQEGDK